MQAWNSTLKIPVIFLFALVGLNYWPVFFGKVPLPTDIIIQFPPFQDYQNEATMNHQHAELGDTVTQFYIWRKFQGEAIRHGVLPLWNPHLLAGTPFQANTLSALFYPFNLLFVLLPMPVAWSLSVMLKIFLSGLFTVLFLHAIGASTSGSIAGGLAFAFGGFMTGWSGWPQTETALWLPFMCYCTLRVCQKPSVRNAVLTAVAFAMPLLAGHPGLAAHVVLAAASYGIWVVAWTRSPDCRRQLPCLLAGGLLALGLAAVQVIPSVEWIMSIYRTLDARWPALPLSNALGLVARDLSSNPSSAGIPIPLGAVYAGALGLLGAVFAPFHQNKRDFIFFMLVLAGSFCVVYGVQPLAGLSEKMPVFQGLKKDEAIVLVDFSLATLAGIGVSRLEVFQWSQSTTRTRILLFVTLLVTTVTLHWSTALLSAVSKPGVDWWRSPRSFRVLLVVGAFLIVLRIASVLSRRQWAVLSSGLLAADLVSFSHAYIPFNGIRTIFPETPTFNFLSAQPQPFHMVAVNDANGANMETFYGLSSAGGYDFMLKEPVAITAGLIKIRYDSITFMAQGIVATSNRILDLLNVKYVLASRSNESRDLLGAQPTRFREIWSDRAVTIFENRNVLPRAFFVPQRNIEVISSKEAQLRRLLEASFDPQSTVMLQDDPRTEVDPPPVSATESKVADYEEKINRVRMKVNVSTPSVLVLTQIHYPGWRASIDGRSAPVLQTDYAFTGTLVGTGSHEIEFRFMPATFVVGAAISLATVLAMILGWRASRRRGHRNVVH